MGFCIEVAIIDGGDRTVKVVHQFFGETEEEAETYRREHLDSCDYFKTAERDGRTRTVIEEVEELPEPEDFEG